MPRKAKSGKSKAVAKPRPKRGPYSKAVVTNAEPDRCPKCKSTSRDEYASIRTREYCGTFQGRPFTSVAHKRTRCRACGQSRVVVFRYFDPEKWGE